jgi:hypothetical protein
MHRSKCPRGGILFEHGEVEYPKETLCVFVHEVEAASTFLPHAVEGRVGEVLTPVEPLAPGDYRIEPSDAGSACTAKISERAGEPGETRVQGSS